MSENAFNCENQAEVTSGNLFSLWVKIKNKGTVQKP